MIVVDRDSDLGQRRVVLGGEGVQLFGAPFCRAVRPEQSVLKIYRDLGDLRDTDRQCSIGRTGSRRPGNLQARQRTACGRRDLDGGDEVLAAVGAKNAYRDLAAREHYRLGEVLEHETESRRGVGHRVGAVEHHETVESGVVVAKSFGQTDPVGGSDVRRVYRTETLVVFDLDTQLFQSRDLALYIAEIERPQRARSRIGNHADGSAGVDQQYFRRGHFLTNATFFRIGSFVEAATKVCP